MRTDACWIPNVRGRASNGASWRRFGWGPSHPDAVYDANSGAVDLRAPKRVIRVTSKQDDERVVGPCEIGLGEGATLANDASMVL